MRHVRFDLHHEDFRGEEEGEVDRSGLGNRRETMTIRWALEPRANRNTALDYPRYQLTESRSTKLHDHCQRELTHALERHDTAENAASGNAEWIPECAARHLAC